MAYSAFTKLALVVSLKTGLSTFYLFYKIHLRLLADISKIIFKFISGRYPDRLFTQKHVDEEKSEEDFLNRARQSLGKKDFSLKEYVIS